MVHTAQEARHPTDIVDLKAGDLRGTQESSDDGQSARARRRSLIAIFFQFSSRDSLEIWKFEKEEVRTGSDIQSLFHFR